mmetsp:Transcript_39885/g.93310  ORF Transcript_39885/g.93310 Transcript_39885/m.93310 type:complete len:339 (-) Transcript_39885:2879-3895(-)
MEKLTDGVDQGREAGGDDERLEELEEEHQCRQAREEQRGAVLLVGEFKREGKASAQGYVDDDEDDRQEAGRLPLIGQQARNRDRQAPNIERNDVPVDQLAAYKEEHEKGSDGGKDARGRLKPRLDGRTRRGLVEKAHRKDAEKQHKPELRQDKEGLAEARPLAVEQLLDDRMPKHLGLALLAHDSERRLPRVGHLLGVAENVLEVVVGPQPAVLDRLRVPQQPIHQRLHQAGAVAAQDPQHLRVRVVQLLAPIVVVVAIRLEAQRVRDQKLRKVVLAVADRPVDGREDGAVHLDAAHPRHALAARGTRDGVLQLVQVAVDQGHGDEVGAHVERPGHAG